jgi:hypothetical protein
VSFYSSEQSSRMETTNADRKILDREEQQWYGNATLSACYFMDLQSPHCYLLLASSSVSLVPEGQSKRQRKTSMSFVAAPSSGNTKMETEKQVSRYRKKTQNNKYKLERIQQLVSALPPKMVAAQLMPEILQISNTTKYGRCEFARAISQQPSSVPVNLPNGGTSKSAVNRAKQTMVNVITGLSKHIAPQNPTSMLDLMAQWPSSQPQRGVLAEVPANKGGIPPQASKEPSRSRLWMQLDCMISSDDESDSEANESSSALHNVRGVVGRN